MSPGAKKETQSFDLPLKLNIKVLCRPIVQPSLPVDNNIPVVKTKKGKRHDGKIGSPSHRHIITIFHLKKNALFSL